MQLSLDSSNGDVDEGILPHVVLVQNKAKNDGKGEKYCNGMMGETKDLAHNVHILPAVVVVPPLPPVASSCKCVALKHFAFMSFSCQGWQGVQAQVGMLMAHILQGLC
eukprot:7787887-Prorocentrum_lima.AAC.1